MNLNDLARTITLREGGNISLSIAQVKEVMRLLLIELAQMTPRQALRIIERYEKR